MAMEEIVEAVATGGKAAVAGLAVGAALVLTGNLRPLAKQAIKGYLVLSRGMRKAASEAREGLQDIYAEAKAEQEGRAVHTGVQAEAGTPTDKGIPASGAEP